MADSKSSPPQAPDDETTGVPGLKSWRGVYLFVLAVFALWVGLLTWFSRSFS